MATQPLNTADLDTCLIEGKYGDELILMIVLARDGTINRFGDGSTAPADTTLYIGIQREPLFDALMEAVPEELLELPGGRVEDPDRDGTDCTLSVMFGARDGSARTYEAVFGSESGAPADLQAIYRRAVELTQPWWESQPGRPHSSRRAGELPPPPPRQKRRWFRRN